MIIYDIYTIYIRNCHIHRLDVQGVLKRDCVIGVNKAYIYITH